MKGQNSKAVEARERKAAASSAKREAEDKRKEDAKWTDDDKLIAAKQARKAEADMKAEERMRKRQELRELEAQEIAALPSQSKKKSEPKKLTRAEIQLRQIQLQQESAKAAIQKKKEEEDLLQPNINHLLREERLEQLLSNTDAITATDLDDALHQLESTPAQGDDRHPEKRLKAAYSAYEEEWLARYKIENPKLKRSQAKERIFKQWQKAPENPLNQV